MVNQPKNYILYRTALGNTATPPIREPVGGLRSILHWVLAMYPRIEWQRLTDDCVGEEAILEVIANQCGATDNEQWTFEEEAFGVGAPRLW